MSLDRKSSLDVLFQPESMHRSDYSILFPREHNSLEHILNTKIGIQQIIIRSNDGYDSWVIILNPPDNLIL